MSQHKMGIRQPANLGQGFRLICLIFFLGLVTASASQPNLTPFQKSGWSEKIVVSRTTGTTTDSTGLTTDDTLYVSWAVINNGTAATASLFYTDLYVDGTLTHFWCTEGLSALVISWGSVYEFSPDGEHTVWNQTAVLTASDGGSPASVSLGGDGNTVLAGALRAHTPRGNGAGRAYVFAWTGRASKGYCLARSSSFQPLTLN